MYRRFLHFLFRQIIIIIIINNKKALKSELARQPDQERTTAMFLGGMLLMFSYYFVMHSFKMSRGLSEPQIITRRNGANGGPVEILDDFREA